MALSDVFLSPLGLAALAALIPLALLYLIRPDPATVRLPTVRFLVEEQRQDTTTPLLERLRRNALLLLQALVVVLLALSLASPYVAVSQEEVVEETVLVIDDSASMTTLTGDGSRFSAAVAAAREDVTDTTSVVTTSGGGRVVLRDGGRQDAMATLDRLRASHTSGSLRAAIAQAAAVAGEESRIVVYSDFAGDAAWTDEVAAARGRGLSVDLRRFGGGGENNVGIVDRSFSGTNVTVSVKNFGDEATSRTVALGSQRRSVTLQPGDVGSVSLAVPAGGGELSLSPGDSFPTDDTAYVAAPSDAAIEVLVLTNDENQYLTTALSLVDQVDLTVKSPPANVDSDYDIIVYSNIERGRLLESSLEAGREAVENGGGVVVQAQPNGPDYGDLSIFAPNGTKTNPTVGRVAETSLTSGVSFPPPSEYLTGELREGESLVTTTSGTPLIATAERDGGRLLYYGYIEESSAFKYNYLYPVFWKRAVFHLVGRDSLPTLNRETGGELEFTNETTVETPDGSVTATTVPLDRVGYYEVGDRRLGVSLYSESESDVESTPLDQRDDLGAISARVEERRVPQPLTGAVAVLALVGVLGELFYLRRRGDL